MTYYAENKERAKANARKWQEANPERVKELGAAWRKAHPDYSKEYGREYRKAHPELKLRKRKRGVRKPRTPEQRAIAALWYAEKRRKLKLDPRWLAARAEHLVRRESKKEATKERRRARVRAYQKEHPEIRRRNEANREAKKRGSGGKLSRGIYKRLLALQRGLCVICRIRLDKYHLDHIIPLAGGGAHTDRNVQLLCPPCNLSKNAKHPVDFMQERGYLI